MLLLFLGNASFYSLAVPIWEAPDEAEHFQYVRYLPQAHALPSHLPSIQIDGNQEAKQPPLYYLLALPFALGVDLGDAGRIRQNPHLTWKGDPAIAAHTQDEAWPYHGVVLAAHRMRLLSVLLGAATVALTYAIAATCLGDVGAALLAAALVALLPGFLFASATIDNDALADTLAAGLLLIAVRATPAGARRSALGFGAVGTLALLAKLNIVVPITVGIIALTPLSAGRRRVETTALALLGLAPGIAFWTWRIGGGERDPLGRALAAPPLPGSGSPPDWGVPAEFVRNLWTSFFGTFGSQDVWLPPWLYALYGAVLLGGIAGAVRAAQVAPELHRPGRRLGLLCCWTLAVLASMVGSYVLAFQHRIGYDHSRFLYPALPAIATIVAYGWSEGGPALLGGLRRLRGPALAGGAALAMAVPWAVIRPAYPAPFPVSTGIPPRATVVAAGRFIQSVTLAAVELPAEPVGAGQGTFVTFYWRVQVPLPAGTWLFVHVEDGHGHTAAAFDGAPLYGALPVSDWRAGDVVADREVLTVHRDAPSGSYIVRVGWYQPKTGARIPLAAGGNELAAGSMRVAPADGA